MIPSTLPKVSIFIPTFNDRTDLLACLESIRQIDYPRDRIEIVIWDNASGDDTAAAVRLLFSEMKSEKWMGLKLIEWGENEGSYIPYNLVQENLSPESQYILGLDADVELSRNSLIDLVQCAQKEKAAVVGARSVYYTQPGLTSHGAGFVNRFTGFYQEKDFKQCLACDYVIGCCWLLNKSCFQLLGGFDPDYYITHWEVDYCLHARKKGLRVLYEPGAIALHKIPLNGTRNPARIYYLYRNKIMLIKKTFNPIGKWFALLLNFTLGLSKALAESVIRNRGVEAGEIKLILNAFGDGFLNKSGKAAFKE